MTDTTAIVNNGVNVEALIAAREALTKAPQAAQFKWRAACEWKDGTHSHSTVEGFYGLGEEQHRKTTFKFDAAAQQYIYNWKTGTGGNYWRIGVKFDDGQTYYVNIGLR